MNLKLVFRIYFGIGALMTAMMLVAPAAMMESYGMTLTDEIKLFIQFMIVAYASMLIVTWMLPAWLGDDLSKAGFAYVIIASGNHEYLPRGHWCVTGINGPISRIRYMGCICYFVLCI